MEAVADTEQAVRRLIAAGVPASLAVASADTVNVYEVEALVYARGCPPELAVQIATLDTAPFPDPLVESYAIVVREALDEQDERVLHDHLNRGGMVIVDPLDERLKKEDS